MSSILTHGSILRTYNHDTNGQPFVQIIDIKKINSGSTGARYRLVISDSVHYQQAMLATQLNSLIEDQQIKQFSVVQLKEYICNVVANRRIVIILQLDVVQGQHHGSTIGTPSNVSDASKRQAAPPAVAAPPQQNYQNQNQSYSNNQSNNNSYQSNQSSSNSYQSNQSNYQSTNYSKPQNSYSAPQNNYSAPQSGYGAPQAKQQQAFHPIASLNPYRNRWTIKGRVTQKSDMRTWTNARGEGKLFSVELLDTEGGQIKATMFNEAADKFYPIFQQDKVYVISKGNLKLANKKFNRLPNEYELTLNADAEVTFFGEDSTIMKQKFDFCSIERIQQKEPNDFIDLIGVARSCSALQTLISQRTQRELKKRTLQITDNSLMSVDLTLWGETAEKYTEADFENDPVVAVKAVKVSDFGGRSLNCSFNSVFFINPDIKEAHEMQAWFESKGKSASVQSISAARGGGGATPKKTFASIKDEQMGYDGKASWIQVRSTITFFTHDPEKPPWYNACPTKDCNKKVTPDDSGGGWYCDKCSKTFPNFQPRYILRLMACDGTGSEWLTAFNEAAESLLGKTAAELNQIKEDDNIALFESVFQEANFKQYMLKLRVKVETNEDQLQQRCHLIQASPIDFKAESRYLLEQIAGYA